MIYDWFSNLIGRERRTEARDSSKPASQKIEDMVSMVRDPEASFSVSKTLETIEDVLTELTSEEKMG